MFFSSKVIHNQINTMLLGNSMHVMAQTLKGCDGPHLPQSLNMINTYTKLTSGSQQVEVVVKNQMVTLITNAKGINVIQVVAANVIPPVEAVPRTLSN